jgi:hypothetical protein
VICCAQAQLPTAEVIAMFSLYCPTCDLSFLAWTPNLIALQNTDHGPVGLLHCPRGHFNAIRFHGTRRPATDDLVRGDRGVGRVAYLRGRPASEWINATSKRRPAREHTTPATAA